MVEQLKLKSASLLFNYAFPLYRWMYFNFKNKKDAYNLRLIRKFIRPGNTVLDIGANIGFYTRFLSECAGGNGHIFSFEPDKINFLHLKNELKERTNVTLIQKAVASESGMLTLYTSPLLNVDHRTYEPENYTDKYSVEKISIDDFVNGKFKVDFIKMDIQGFEADALKGMEKTLQENHNIILFTELWAYGLEKAGNSTAEVFDLLSTNGFNIYKIDSEKLTLINREDTETMKVGFFSDTNVVVSRNHLNNNFA